MNGKSRPPGLPPEKPEIPGTIQCQSWSVSVWRHADGHARLLVRHGGAVLDLVLADGDRAALANLLTCPLELVPVHARLAAGSRPQPTFSGRIAGGGIHGGSTARWRKSTGRQPGRRGPMTGSRMIDVGDIARRLNGDALRLCRHLFPLGIVDGDNFRIGSLAGEKGRSLAVRIKPPRHGMWVEFNGGTEKGDALDLVSKAACGGDKGKAVRWAKQWLGLEDGRPSRAPPPRPAINTTAAKPRDNENADNNKNRDNAIRLWLAARASLLDTPAEAYLHGRGIELRRLAVATAALRFHPSCFNRECGYGLPAIVAAIHGRDGRICAVHRTWIMPGDNNCPDGRPGSGSTGWIKADLANPKMTLGRYLGGAVRIWRGRSRLPLAKAPAGDTVAICEGIEDALTVALACREWRVLCAVSLMNMAAIALPPQIERVVLVADNEDNAAARAAAEKQLANAVRRYQREGRRVVLARAPAEFKDFNEILQKGA